MGYDVRLISAAEKEVEKLIGKHPEALQELEELLIALETQPQIFPKKQGKLKSCRAASLKVGSNAWRLIFRIKEKQNEVEILALGPHDDAYDAAERRV